MLLFLDVVFIWFIDLWLPLILYFRFLPDISVFVLNYVLHLVHFEKLAHLLVSDLRLTSPLLIQGFVVDALMLRGSRIVFYWNDFVSSVRGDWLL